VRGPDPCICQGSVRNLASSAGTITDTYIYTAFGVELLTSGSTTNPFWYVGRYGYYRDMPELMQVRARWLSAMMGRWLSRDPIWLAMREWNPHLYAGNDPIAVADPSGLQGMSPHALPPASRPASGEGGEGLVGGLSHPGPVNGRGRELR